MIRPLLSKLRGATTVSLMTANVITWYCPMMVFTVLKLIIPVTTWRDAMTHGMTRCAEFWSYSNRLIFRLMLNVRWEFRGTDQLRRHDWYLVISNHQSWVDILALQQAFTGRIPFLKFFLKQSLIWVPFLGQAWWALDMPFMKRYSREQLKRQPELRGKDLETTRKACQHFSRTPTSIFNFVEGTRLTADKHRASQSPYRHLLPPRAGGIAFTMGSMGNILRRLLDVSIVYPDGPGSFWDFCSGKIRRIIVDIRELPLDSWMAQGDYTQDDDYRQRFQQWLTRLWEDKDARIESILLETNGRPALR